MFGKRKKDKTIKLNKELARKQSKIIEKEKKLKEEIEEVDKILNTQSTDSSRPKFSTGGDIYTSIIQNSDWRYRLIIEENTQKELESLLLETQLILQDSTIHFSEIEKAYDAFLAACKAILLDLNSVIVSKSLIIDIFNYGKNVLPAIVNKAELLINSSLVNWKDYMKEMSTREEYILDHIILILKNAVMQGFSIRLMDGLIIGRYGSQGAYGYNLYFSKEFADKFNKFIETKHKIKQIAASNLVTNRETANKINIAKALTILRDTVDSDMNEVNDEIDALEARASLTIEQREQERKNISKRMSKAEREKRISNLKFKKKNALNLDENGEITDLGSYSRTELLIESQKRGLDLDEFLSRSEIIEGISSIIISEDELEELTSLETTAEKSSKK